MTRLCVAIFVTDFGKAKRDIALAAERGADMVELRIDQLTDAHAVREALEPSIAEIINAIRGAIEEAPPEVTTDIYYSEVMLTGGGALLQGMAERLQRELKLRVRLADEPLLAVAMGAGRLLEEPDKLQRAVIRQDIHVWEGSQELVVNW